jgi:hypothetical protein
MGRVGRVVMISSGVAGVHPKIVWYDRKRFPRKVVCVFPDSQCLKLVKNLPVTDQAVSLDSGEGIVLPFTTTLAIIPESSTH